MERDNSRLSFLLSERRRLQLKIRRARTFDSIQRAWDEIGPVNEEIDKIESTTAPAGKEE